MKGLFVSAILLCFLITVSFAGHSQNEDILESKELLQMAEDVQKLGSLQNEAEAPVPAIFGKIPEEYLKACKFVPSKITFEVETFLPLVEEALRSYFLAGLVVLGRLKPAVELLSCHVLDFCSAADKMMLELCSKSSALDFLHRQFNAIMSYPTKDFDKCRYIGITMKVVMTHNEYPNIILPETIVEVAQKHARGKYTEREVEWLSGSTRERSENFVLAQFDRPIHGNELELLIFFRLTEIEMKLNEPRDVDQMVIRREN